MAKIFSNFFVKGTIQRIQKIYKIKLANEENSKQILSQFDTAEFGFLFRVLEEIKEGAPTLLDPNSAGSETVSTIINLTAKYSPRELAEAFKVLRKAKLLNPDGFDSFLSLLNKWNHERDCKTFIKIFQQFADICSYRLLGDIHYYDFRLKELFSLKASSDGLCDLQKILENYGFILEYKCDKLFLQSNESLKTILDILNLLSKSDVLLTIESHARSSILHVGDSFYSPRALKVRYQLLSALKNSNLLSEYNLKKLTSLQPDPQLRGYHPESIEILTQFIPTILSLSNQNKLTQSIFQDILLDVENALKNSYGPVKFFLPNKKMSKPSTYSGNPEEARATTNAFFEGTTFILPNPLPQESSVSIRVTENLPPYSKNIRQINYLDK